MQQGHRVQKDEQGEAAGPNPKVRASSRAKSKPAVKRLHKSAGRRGERVRLLESDSSSGDEHLLFDVTERR